MKKVLRKVAPFVAFAAILAVLGVGGLYVNNTFFGPKPPAKFTELTKDNVQTELVKSKGLVLVEVCVEQKYACEIMDKELDKFNDQYGANVKILVVHADTQPELAAQFGISSILDVPAVFLFQDGKPVSAVPGVWSAEELPQILQAMAEQAAAGTNGGGTGGTTNGGSTVPDGAATPAPSGK